jgi:Tol biopolymer transport system component
VSGLFVAAIDGSGLRQLTAGSPDDGSDIQPTFYPSGKRIAFVRLGGEPGDLYSIGLDGSGLRPVTSDSIRERAPAVSPNGRQIAYECTGFKRDGIESSDDHICSVRPNGSHWRDLTPRFQGGKEAFDPEFSPSGRTIAFTLGPGTAADVFTMRSNGTRIGSLTNRGPRGGRIFPRSTGYADPAFSPAGDSIVVVARTGSEPRLARIRLDDRKHPRLLGEGLIGRSPVWAPLPRFLVER